MIIKAVCVFTFNITLHFLSLKYLVLVLLVFSFFSSSFSFCSLLDFVHFKAKMSGIQAPNSWMLSGSCCSPSSGQPSIPEEKCKKRPMRRASTKRLINGRQKLGHMLQLMHPGGPLARIKVLLMAQGAASFL